MVHTVSRDDAFRLVCQEAGVAAAVVRTDYTGEAGARATRRVLDAPERPTAIMYDNDVMAVAGLGIAQEMGLSVPADLSLVAWEDSTLCQVVRPPLTVLKRDNAAYGFQAAQLLHATIAGDAPASVQAETAQLVIRDSSGPACS
jgi:DNA-binding LacI/PurR family transcriptional regulator